MERLRMLSLSSRYHKHHCVIERYRIYVQRFLSFTSLRIVTYRYILLPHRYFTVT